MDREIKKVKYQNDVVTIDYEDSIAIGEEINGTKKTEESTVTPHPDFVNDLRTFKGYLIDIFYWGDKKENMEPLIEVTGISLQGKDDKKGIVISGKLETSAKKVAINSPRIVFANEIFGWEEQLENDIDQSTEEAKEYLKGKKAQLSIYDAIEQETSDDEEPDPETDDDEESDQEADEQDVDDDKTPDPNADVENSEENEKEANTNR